MASEALVASEDGVVLVGMNTLIGQVAEGPGEWPFYRHPNNPSCAADKKTMKLRGDYEGMGHRRQFRS